MSYCSGCGHELTGWAAQGMRDECDNPDCPTNAPPVARITDPNIVKRALALIAQEAKA